MRCFPAKAFEHCGKVSLGLKSDAKGGLYHAVAPIKQKLLGLFDAASEHVFVRAQACGRPELGCKVHRREARDECQVRQLYRIGQVRINVLDGALEAPFCERSVFVPLSDGWPLSERSSSRATIARKMPSA